ncbi:hypothetical protein [Altererythrobacter sp. GH1-8]|uniref:hypothetical protein n=1 Tax=Altererythrobacter sp. GH1-8 TaxID=3349333 RepID=UPI00374DCDD8
MSTEKFQNAITDYKRLYDHLPDFNRHMPDTLFSTIETVDDFVELVNFIKENLEYDRYFEYEESSTSEFVVRLADKDSLSRRRE